METLSDRIRLEDSWKEHLSTEFEKPYMSNLRAFLADELKSGKTIYPRGTDIFRALDLTNFENVKVVLIGQDPYHGPNQAHGLCFSVQKGVRIPPSLLNIYKELKSDLGIEHSKDGDLQKWAEQGVLLLNATLTVEKSKAGSHQGKGWEAFTDRIIEALNNDKENLVFILWGSYAQKKGQFIDRGKHFVIQSPHPSPLSAHRGFLGSRPFSKVNAYLKGKGIKEVDWTLN